jgi:hypothetical protein
MLGPCRNDPGRTGFRTQTAQLTSRPFALPARVQAVTFPDAQHGYLVGQHAPVYRYRIVPVDYKIQGMFAATAQ